MKSNQTEPNNSSGLEHFYQSCANQYLRALYQKDFLACYFLWSSYFEFQDEENNIDNKKIFHDLEQDLVKQHDKEIIDTEKLYKERYQKISALISLREEALNQGQGLNQKAFDLINELLIDSDGFRDRTFLEYIRDNADDCEFEAFRYQAARIDLYRAIDCNDQDSFINIVNQYPNLSDEIDVYGQSLNHILLQVAEPNIEMARIIADNSYSRYGCNFSLYNQHPLIMACEIKRYDLLDHFLNNCDYNANIINSSGRNPMLLMVYGDQTLRKEDKIEICKKLIEKGAFDNLICASLINDLQLLHQMNNEEKENFIQQVIKNERLNQQLENKNRNLNEIIKENEEQKKLAQKRSSESKARDRALIAKLKAENKELKAENKELKAENKELKAENKELKAENNELQRQLDKSTKLLQKNVQEKTSINNLKQTLLDELLTVQEVYDHLQQGNRPLEEILNKINQNSKKSDSAIIKDQNFENELPIQQNTNFEKESDILPQAKKEENSTQTLIPEDNKTKEPEDNKTKEPEDNKTKEPENNASKEAQSNKAYISAPKKTMNLKKLNYLAQESKSGIVFDDISEINKTDQEGRSLIYYVLGIKNDQERHNLIVKLINTGIDVNLADADGDSVVMKACSMGLFEEAKLLLENGADLMQKDSKGNSVLHRACLKKNFAEIKNILEFAEKIEKKSEIINITNRQNGQTPYHSACYATDKNKEDKIGKNIVFLLLENGAEFGKKDDRKRVALDLIGNKNLRKEISAKESQIDKDRRCQMAFEKNPYALHQACLEGNFEMLKFAQKTQQINKMVTKVDENGDTPYHVACRQGHKDIALFLIENGALFGIKNKEGKVASELITDNQLKHKILDEENLSLSHIISGLTRSLYNQPIFSGELSKLIDNIDGKGNSAIFAACASDKVEAVRALLKSGRKINFTDDRRYNSSLLHCCARMMSKETLKYLIEEGFDVNERDSQGRTPLHYLVQSQIDHTSGAIMPQENSSNFRKILTFLLKAGADLEDKSYNNTSPLEMLNQITSPQKRQELLDIVNKVKEKLATQKSSIQEGGTVSGENPQQSSSEPNLKGSTQSTSSSNLKSGEVVKTVEEEANNNEKGFSR